MDDGFERVYTVHDYDDGPRGGLADFGGAPHAYRSLWDADAEDWEETFSLSPVTAEQVALVMEDWAIWCRWQVAFHAGETTEETHPALPADRARHEELKPLVDRALEIDPARRRIAVGTFRVVGPALPGPRVPSSRVPLQVRWTVVE